LYGYRKSENEKGMREKMGEKNEGKRWIKLKEVMEYYEIGEMETKICKLEQFVKMISERRVWGSLTSRNMNKRIEEAIVESILVMEEAECEEKDVVEIGSGGGILGVVVAIMRPGWKVTMTERNGRKAAFLAEVIGKIGIKNAEVFHGDAALLAKERGFDLCLSRGSGKLVDIAPLAMGLLRPGGRYIAIKQKEVDREIEEAKVVIEESGGAQWEQGIMKKEPQGSKGGVSLVVIGKSQENEP